MASSAQYDFVVVGAGPAGCVIAAALAKSKSAPTVLLVEAGGDNSDVSLRIEGNKFVQILEPSQAWGYVSVAQSNLSDRSIDMARGKGLGGSSAVNFTVWSVGPRDDWETIAGLTGDQAWTLENAQKRWRSLSSFHGKSSDIPGGMERYLQPKHEEYGTEGPLHIGFPSKWDNDVTDMMDIWEANGYSINTDASDGHFLGISVTPLSAYRGVRSTAADVVALGPKNLHMITGAQVHRVAFDGKRATGVTLVDGRTIRASKEVVISAGSLDTPKILMHSGIGARGELSKFNIPVLHENPSVGQNYRDHYHIMMKYQRANHASDKAALFMDKSRQEAALREWHANRTGDYAQIGCAMSLGFFKSDGVLDSEEFSDLPGPEKARLSQPTIPSYEVCFNVTAPDYYINPKTAGAISTVLVFVLNGQGKGELRLQSADPTVPLAFDPDFLDHPYDRRVAIEATRETMRVTRSPAFQKDNLADLDVPQSDSDEDILAFWRDNCTSTWHMSSTCKMGKSEQEDEAVVDTDFKVFGVQGLRVADMSVMPILIR